MKTTRILSLAMIMAMGMIAGLQASVTEHQPPAPLPEFKTPEQLAKWRTETTAKTSAQEASRLSTLDSLTPFYTGKPFLAESSSYAFKYREYNPEMGRWTTVDPSGFPDGANNRVYAAVPTIMVDNNGLATLAVTDDGNGNPANHVNSIFTWTWSISHNGQIVLSGGNSQTATALYVNQNISQFGGITVPHAQVGQSYTFEFYSPGEKTQHSTVQTFYTSATESSSTYNYGTWVDTGWSLTALAFDSVGVTSYTGLNNQPNDIVNNGVKLLNNSNFGGGINSYLVSKLVNAGFHTASKDSDKFYVGGGGKYNE